MRVRGACGGLKGDIFLPYIRVENAILLFKLFARFSLFS